MHARDIADDVFVDAVRQATRLPNIGANRWATGAALNEATGIEWPEKVVLAKFTRLEKRGVLTGCNCGCRGDWLVVVTEDHSE
jgi:hypothetical protein